MTTLTSAILIFVFLALYLNSVQLKSSGSWSKGKSSSKSRQDGKSSSGSAPKGKPCLDNCQCPNGTACLPVERGSQRCQKCDCKIAEQCVKLMNETIICNCSDQGYTGVFCETKIEEKTCPDGWTKLRASCYIKIATRMTWSNAKTKCESIFPEAHLIEGDDNGELYDVVPTFYEADYYYWVGGADTIKEGTFFWSHSGELVNTLTYTVKTNDQERDCVYIHTGLKWLFAGACALTFPFVCELEM